MPKELLALFMAHQADAATIATQLGVPTQLSNNLLAVGDFQTNIAAFTGTARTNLAPGNAAIVVNNNGAFFNSGYTLDQGKIQGGTAEADVFVLLHELGHGLGASRFQSDYNNKSAGTANDLNVQMFASSRRRRPRRRLPRPRGFSSLRPDASANPSLPSENERCGAIRRAAQKQLHPSTRNELRTA